MKRILLVTLFLTALFAVNISAQTDAEKAAVRVPLDNYLKGHATGEAEYFKKAFHPEGKLTWIRDGRYMWRSVDEYIGGATGKPAADEAKRKRWIESVDISGTAATAKIILDYPTVKFVDYMSLLKIDGEWKIINKSFSTEPKAKPDEPKKQ